MELSELQKTIFIRCLARVIEDGYGELDNVCSGDITAADADIDPDDIRCQLSDAIGEAAYLSMLDADSAEAEGLLYDLLDETYPALAEYLTATTDTHLKGEEVQS